MESQQWILLSFGIMAFLTGAYRIYKYNKLISSGIKTDGTIIDFENSGDDDGITLYSKISFQTLERETIIKKCNIVNSRRGYKIGDTVDVYYDKENCTSFIVDNKNTKHLGLVFLTIGLAFIIFSVLQYFFHFIIFQ
jgi:hypothetical protein